MSQTTLADSDHLTEEPCRSLAERAYNALLQRILHGELAAGSLLQERALADELQISRTPVREALSKLESEGLVRRHSGRLLTVREIPVQELMQVLNVRAILEVEAVSLAVGRAPRHELRRLRELFETQMKGPIPDEGNHWDADDLLHHMVAEASGNAVLVDLVRALRRKTRIFNLKRMPERFIPGSLEHLAIIAALDREDREGARVAMASHLENTKQSILHRISRV